MFEHSAQPPINRRLFIIRLLKSGFSVIFLVVLSLGFGTLGYRLTEGLSWIDSFYNASLIMSGMGPVSELTSNSAKIFASLYSIYSGFFLILATGFLLTPIFHRILHKFHFEKNKPPPS